MPKNQAIAVASRLVLGAVFVSAGLSKIWSPENAAGFAAYWLPEQMDAISSLLVIVVAAIEFGVGLLLISGSWIRTVACFTCGLVAVLSAFLVLSHIRGDAPSCGCFGAAGAQLFDQNTWAAYLRNLALVGLCMTAIAASDSSRVWDHESMESERAPA